MTTRRQALKLGALVAAPVASLAPAAALASDGTAERLARMEDERAITELVKDFVRRFNGSGECGEFVASAGAIRIAPQVRAIREDTAHDPQVVFDETGRSAHWQSRTVVELLTDFEGDTTMEKMARFQRQGSAATQTRKRLEANLARTPRGWTITRLTLA